ncbi:MAG: Uma2 family endonuclease [Leptospiraceae bacterium]|nr:Uma2 family endonuclease [Leptospiraceae bacterium]MCP5496346.1 Uma2 family endonuclease [Leptospiraceae bacterium]
MILFTPVFETEKREPIRVPKYEGVKMGLEVFLNYKFEEFNFKYEWNNGVLEAEEKVKDSERYIIDNICRKFAKTKYYENGDSILPEADVHLKELGKYRRPDAVYFQKDQIRKQKSFQTPPLFIIEIISPSNSSIEVEKKTKEYFQAGIKVVWHIYPSLKEVKIYYSAKQVRICNEDDVCDVGNILSDFNLSISDIFKE